MRHRGTQGGEKFSKSIRHRKYQYASAFGGATVIEATLVDRRSAAHVFDEQPTGAMTPSRIDRDTVLGGPLPEPDPDQT
ncbi:MAG TPA: hypothetical protein VEX40_05945 [Mycobacterium sp.]|nr:hypothetical protein [Mycobacterium sp.]